MPLASLVKMDQAIGNAAINMNLTQYRKVFTPLLLVSIVVILTLITVSIYLIFRVNKKNISVDQEFQSIPKQGQLNKISPPSTKPEELPTNVQQIRQKIISSQIENRNGDLLLAKTDLYEIEYIPAPNVFFITILKEPAKTAKKQAQDWFLKFGLQNSDLCDLPIRFLIRDRNLRKANPNLSSLPDGCTP